MIVSIGVICVLLTMSAFFSASETALFSLSSIERKRIGERTDPRGRFLAQLIAKPTDALITILIGNMIVNTVLTCYVTLLVIKYFGYQWLGIALSAFTLVLLMVGEIFPKNIALVYGGGIAAFVAVPLGVCSYVFKPLVIILSRVTEKVLALFQAEMKSSHGYSDEDMRTIVAISQDEGVIGEEQREKLENIFSFGDRKVREIMVPRTDMGACNIDDGLDSLITLSRKLRVRHMVMYKGTIDTIVGVIFTKDLLLDPTIGLKKILKQPVYVPELKKIDALASEMSAKKYECAICVDEHGGTAGIVSQDEIVGAIFGELHEEEYETHLGRDDGYLDGEIVVDGGISLYELNKLLSDAADFDSGHYDSLRGLLLDHLGDVPTEGTSIIIKNVEFIIVRVIKNRIEQVMIKMGGLHG